MRRLIAILVLTIAATVMVSGCIVRTPGHRHRTYRSTHRPHGHYKRHHRHRNKRVYKSRSRHNKRCGPGYYWNGARCVHH